ncbi:hypothetical protein ACT3CD_13425 [Geofilum sp. OHC36d9]|uniref:hypothetical protein n=1 Tax=Geofilum sp. OHC36d9 TaxID=3458413 RepID=UPI004033F7D6
MNKLVTSLYLLGLFVVNAEGQHLTSSPYSMYGAGQYETGENGRSSALGGTGIGMNSSSYVNILNPASYSHLTPGTFYFDVGVAARMYTYTGSTGTEKSSEGNVNRLAMGFKPMKKWGMAFGFVPYTTTGYKIYDPQYIEGSTQKEDVWFEGSGGLSKVFLGNAFQISPSLSLGINTSFIFGAIYQDEIQSALTISQKSYTRAIYADLGLQYQFKLTEKMPLSIGLTYGSGKKLKMSNEIDVKQSDESLILEDDLADTYIYMPEQIGVGLWGMVGEKFSYGIDLNHLDWSENKSGSSDIGFTQQDKISTGIEFIPRPRTATNFLQGLSYRAGFSIANDYLVISNNNPLTYNVTGGIGFPLKRGSSLDVSVAYEDQLDASTIPIKTSAVKFTISMSFAETWFMRRKLE